MDSYLSQPSGGAPPTNGESIIDYYLGTSPGNISVENPATLGDDDLLDFVF